MPGIHQLDRGMIDHGRRRFLSDARKGCRQLRGEYLARRVNEMIPMGVTHDGGITRTIPVEDDHLPGAELDFDPISETNPRRHSIDYQVRAKNGSAPSSVSPTRLVHHSVIYGNPAGRPSILILIELLDALERVSVTGIQIGPNPFEPREPERIARIVFG